MNNMKRVAKTLSATSMAALGLAGLAAMNSALAATDEAGWLIGANVGQARARIDDARIKAKLQTTGLATTSMADEDTDAAFKIFGGYQFNRNFLLEGGYFNLGKFSYMATTLPAGTLRGEIKLQGLNLDAVGILPLNERFSAFGRFGVQYAQAKDSFSSTGAVAIPVQASPSKNALNYKAGLGIQYDINKSLGVRAEGERYRINDAVGSKGDINLFSIGMVYRLGQKEVSAPVVAIAPLPPPPIAVAVEPPPVAPPRPMPPAAVAPRTIVVPVVVKTQQYCSVLDIQFEIKQEEVQREDKEKLAVLGTYMNKYPDTTAVIEGFTDNVGESAYNLKLSQKRADSVMSYLVNELYVAPSRLSAIGYGESYPIADNNTREGKQANRRINAVIACVTDITGLDVLPARITMAMELEFDPYKSSIEPQYFDGLRQVADFMKANPAVTATVEGHAGKYLGTGSNRVKTDPVVAMKVSLNRAKNVVEFLADQGISRSRLSTEAYGQTGRVAYGTTLEEQQENRRVNIILTYPKR